MLAAGIITILVPGGAPPVAQLTLACHFVGHRKLSRMVLCDIVCLRMWDWAASSHMLSVWQPEACHLCDVKSLFAVLLSWQVIATINPKPNQATTPENSY